MTAAEGSPRRRRHRAQRPAGSPPPAPQPRYDAAAQPRYDAAAERQVGPAAADPVDDNPAANNPADSRSADTGRVGQPVGAVTPRSTAGNGANGNRAGRSTESGRNQGRDPERGWRELVGSSPSQVGPDGAMRARDVARPRPQDLAAAEQNLTVVRRQWQPPPGS